MSRKDRQTELMTSIPAELTPVSRCHLGYAEQHSGLLTSLSVTFRK